MLGLIKSGTSFRFALVALSFLQTLGISLSASALTIADEPLFLSAQISPNVIMAIDDSGSMDGELLMPTNDGAAWWRVDSDSTKAGYSGWGTNADYSTDVWLGGAQINFNQAGGASGTWKKYIYLFPNGTTQDNGGRIYNDATNDHFAIPPLPRHAYFRSVEFNAAYFDPRETYAPWPSLDGNTYIDMPPATAKADPGRSSSMTFDLTANVKKNGANETFRFFTGMQVPAQTEIYVNGAWRILAVGGTVPFTPLSGSTISNNRSYGVSYFPASFYATGASALPDGYGYSATPSLSGHSPGAVVPDLYLYEIKPSNFSSTALYQAAIQNFANWFSYYRKRQLATRGGVAESFKDMTTIRAATFRINNRTDLTMRNMSVAADRDSFFQAVMAPTGSGGTPNRESLTHAGEQLKRTDNNAPVQYACQSNAAILFTDGFSNASSVSPAPGNADGDQGSPYADSVSDTMADIAMKYYKTALRTGAGFPAGRVPVAAACNTANPPPGTDCNRNLHMLTYGVTLGSKGILFDPDTPRDPFATPAPEWWTSFSDRSPRAVDDLWHATINGRGQMLNAKTPTAVATAIKTALNTIVERTGSASAVASNSTRLDTDTFVYQAKFNSADWSGELLAYSVAANGSIGNLAWTTDNGIPAAASRNIVTWNGTQGIDFTDANWASLSQAQRDALDNNDALGRQRLAWIRGDTSLEVNQGGTFRNRTKKLGDIVNSDPLFVKSEDYGFSVLPTEGSSYASYVTGKQNRTPMLYVGANDGMLHGFNASSGSEVFAFIPAGVYGTVALPKLAALASPGYTHRYLVDGPARASDAYINGGWKTMLVGSTGAGGKSIFAIDVSNPVALGASSVLWENTTTGTAMSHPVIARLATGDWVAIYGNGYDSGENVKLNIVSLTNGTLLKSIDTGVAGTGNGLATPLPVDINNDRITDAVYVGDLMGNMWKFDLTGNTSNWGVAFKQGSTPKPLFTAVDSSGVAQAITARATAGRNPEGSGIMVYFGTGKYFESGDNIVGTSPQLQRFYAVYDNGSRVTDTSSLVQQTITNEGTITNFGAYRVTSANTVDYATKKGWYLDLRSPGAANGAGERVVSQALLRDGRVIFTTLIPSNDACAFGGGSWLMELEAVQGGRLTYSVFDVNGDGQINEADFVTLPDGTKVPVGGKGFDEIIKTPGIIGAGDLEYKFTSGSSGTLTSTVEVGGGLNKGRHSWRQLQ